MQVGDSGSARQYSLYRRHIGNNQRIVMFAMQSAPQMLVSHVFPKMA